MNRMTIWMVLALMGLQAIAHADVNSPGWVWFDLVATMDTTPESTKDIIHIRTYAYMSTDASSFGKTGVMIWAGFNWESSCGPRDGVLLLDIDLRGDPGKGDIPIQHVFIKATYQETWAGELLFEGQLQSGQVWIDKLVYDSAGNGAIQGAFRLVFADPNGNYPGSRALTGGDFITSPAPDAVEKANKHGPIHTEYVQSGCMGGSAYYDDPYEEQGCDCGGSEPEEQGCTSDTSDDGWDDDTDSGCEGDTSDDGWDDDTDSGCEGDTYDDSAGDKACAHVEVKRYTFQKRRTQTAYGALNRLLPQLLAVILIFLRRAKA